MTAILYRGRWVDILYKYQGSKDSTRSTLAYEKAQGDHENVSFVCPVYVLWTFGNVNYL